MGISRNVLSEFKKVERILTDILPLSDKCKRNLKYANGALKPAYFRLLILFLIVVKHPRETYYYLISLQAQASISTLKADEANATT